MPDAFSLLVPLAAPYRALAPELAGRYAELVGGSGDAAAQLASAVNAAIDRVTIDAGPHAEVALAFTPAPTSIRVDLTFGARRETVDVTISLVQPANPSSPTKPANPASR